MNLRFKFLRMKTSPALYILLAFISTQIILSSCKKKAKESKLDVNYTTIDFDIPPSAAGTHTYLDLLVYTKIDSVMSANGFSTSEITAAKLREAVLVIRNINPPTAPNFDIADKATLFIGTTSPASLKAALLNSVPHTGLVEISMPGIDQDLDSYMKSASFFVSASVTTNAAIIDTVKMRLKLYFDVYAKQQN